MDFPPLNTASAVSQEVQHYYRFHAPFYDVTRWSFLFGRDSILNMIPDLPLQPRILEIGCGTGRNIERLQYRFPDARMTGIDLSPEMLNKAKKRLHKSTQVKLKLGRYQAGSFNSDSFDLILLSYSLTMAGPQTDIFVQLIQKDLKPGGTIAVVDFDRSSFSWFRRWMEINHVNFGGHLLPLLQKHFHPVEIKINKAYLGVWTYFQFVGRHT